MKKFLIASAALALCLGLASCGAPADAGGPLGNAAPNTVAAAPAKTLACVGESVAIAASCARGELFFACKDGEGAPVPFDGSSFSAAEAGTYTFTFRAEGAEPVTFTVTAEEHDFSLRSDESVHWNECSRCGLRQGQGSHRFVRAADAEGHGQRCAVCGRTAGMEEHVFGWVDLGGSHARACALCEYSEGEDPHTFGAWSLGAGSAVRTCSLCGHAEESPFTALEVLSAPDAVAVPEGGAADPALFSVAVHFAGGSLAVPAGELAAFGVPGGALTLSYGALKVEADCTVYKKLQGGKIVAEGKAPFLLDLVAAEGSFELRFSLTVTARGDAWWESWMVAMRAGEAYALLRSDFAAEGMWSGAKSVMPNTGGFSSVVGKYGPDKFFAEEPISFVLTRDAEENTVRIAIKQGKSEAQFAFAGAPAGELSVLLGGEKCAYTCSDVLFLPL